MTVNEVVLWGALIWRLVILADKRTASNWLLAGSAALAVAGNYA